MCPCMCVESIACVHTYMILIHVWYVYVCVSENSRCFQFCVYVPIFVGAFLYGCTLGFCVSTCTKVHNTSHTQALIDTHTQVVHGDSVVSLGTQRTVSSVMDTSFLFLQSS